MARSMPMRNEMRYNPKGSMGMAQVKKYHPKEAGKGMMKGCSKK